MSKALVLGTMTFGWSKASRTVDSKLARELLDAFKAGGGQQIDTALVYMDQPGIAERMLGEICTDDDHFELHTKAHPMLGVGGKTPDGSGGLSSANLRAQVESSLANLRIASIPLLYLHQPDTQTPLVETLSVCDELHKEGRIQALGLSNYSAKEVREAVELCKERSWLAPTVYQGNYNLLNRDVESELLPLLAQLNIRFLAYNPLAAGLLTGKYTDKGSIPTSGRFAENANYVGRYWKDDTFAGLERVKTACAAEGLTVLQAAFSWLKHNSQLKDATNDGVLIGASSLEQLTQNMEAWQQAAPLSPAVLEAMEHAWAGCKEGAFSYFRGYSGAGGDARVGLTL